MTLFINPNISLFFVGWRGGMGEGGRGPLITQKW